MKQLLSLFLFLLPYLVLAQYPSNGNQKITLGEQTTADGLVYRGVAATDTVRKPSIDTMAYMVLDTTTNIIWHYKKATSNAWLRLNLLPSDTASMLTNYYRSGRTGIIQASDVPTLNQNTTGSAATLTTSRTFQTNLASTSTASFNGSANVTPGVTGTLPVANGGTNATTLTANKVMVGNGTSGVLTPTNLHWDNTNSYLGIGSISPGSRLVVKGVDDTNSNSALHLLNSSNNSLLFVRNDGRIGMGTSTPIYRFVISNQGAEGIELDAGINQSNKNFIVNYNRSTGTYIEMQINASKTIFGTQGNVGVGTETPQVQFHTTGGVRFATFAGGGTTTLSVDNNGDLGRTSSIELKNNITNIKYGLSDILKINPINFNWKDENKFGNENENGFIAEDVYTIIPNVVSSDNNGIFMDYTKLIPILTKAIQEQQALIKALEQRIINLENK